MSDDDLIRRGDVLALQDRFMGVVCVEKIAAIPAVTPGVRVKPLDTPTDLIAQAEVMMDGVTPGPWWHDNNEGYSINKVHAKHPTDPLAYNILAEVVGDSAEAEANAHFIAWCRAGVPALIARIRELDKERDQPAPDVAGLVEAAMLAETAINAALPLNSNPTASQAFGLRRAQEALRAAIAAMEGKP